MAHSHGERRGPPGRDADTSPAGAGDRAGARHASRLAVTFGLVAAFFVVEAVAGYLTNSLALLSDAAHMLTDVVGLGMALGAIHVAGRAGTARGRTFGLYRLEILAALTNAVLLVGVALYVIVEAVRRLGRSPEVLDVPMLVVAVVGLAVNLASFALLREGASESLNVRAAYLEVAADALGSVGVLVAAVVLLLFGWRPIDAIVGVLIGLAVIPRTLRLAGQALRVLVQAAPAGVDVEAIRADLAALPGVVDVHDLHLWTLTSEMEVASAHLMVGVGTDSHAVLDQARDVLRDRYRVVHATLQVEPDTHEGCHEVHW
ncbi:MAG TPA: cation diffusion facilitator family transporter [Acidimicrobiales bacterium]|nr:cation diffusion facilitator family transporter [Acidimicrobiales bacterium]